MVDFIIRIHTYNVYLVITAAAVAGIWGFILYFTKNEKVQPWYIMLRVALGLGLLQALLGITMVLLGKKPGAPGYDLYYLHYVYGGIVALALPVAWTYATNGKNVRRDILIYSIAAIIIVAAGIRAFMTGPA